MTRQQGKGVASLFWAALLLGNGCAVAPDPSPRGATARPLCGQTEHPPLQAGGHLLGEAAPPVAYSSTPPTSGWHASGAVDITVQPGDQPLSEPRQVSVLEAGGVVVTYRDLPPAQRQDLENAVRQRFAGAVAVTSYDAIDPGQVVFAGEGVLQRCDGVDLDALAAFVDAHATADN